MSDNLKIVTFNVRCNWDWLDGFVSRMGLIYDKLQKEAPDVVAFQEVTPQILEGLKHIMPDYLFLGHGRNADYTGEGLYTAINTATLQLIGMETFWIAPDPYDKSSRFCDQSGCPRICVAVTLYHPERNMEFRVYNVHLDHKGDIAITEGMTCVLNNIRDNTRRRPMPTVLLGDFNTEPDSDAVKACADWAEPTLFDVTATLPGTFHEYGEREKNGLPNKKIDYIWLTQELKNTVQAVTLWEDALNGHRLSDHYPVCVTL